MFTLFKRHLVVIQRFALLSDTILALVLFPFTVFIVDLFKLGLPKIITPIGYLNQYWLVLLIYISIFIFTLYKNRSYNYSLPSKRFHVFKIMTTTAQTSIVMAFFVFIFNFDAFSRMVFIVYFLLLFLSIATKRIAEILFLFIFDKRIKKRNVLIIGTGKTARELIVTLNKEKLQHVEFIGLLSFDAPEVGSTIETLEVLGTADDFLKIAKEKVVDDIILVEDKGHSLIEQKNTIMLAEEMGITVNIHSEVFNTLFSSLTLESISNIKMVVYNTTALKDVHLFIKTILDHIFAFLLIILLSPLLLLTVLVIKLTSPGPAVYTATRVTRHGRIFQMYKFRSMIKDAEEQNEKYIQEQQEKTIFKVKDDPRITPFGKIIRKLSIDELPQLFNILKGDMSFIGPRPLLQYDVEAMEPWHRRFLSMKPGLSCLWQISGRSELERVDDKINLDLKYIDNWSLWLDFKILLKTIPLVLIGRGAQ